MTREIQYYNQVKWRTILNIILWNISSKSLWICAPPWFENPTQCGFHTYNIGSNHSGKQGITHDHLNRVILFFQKSYQHLDMTHIFPLDQIHSWTYLFHHIWNNSIWSNQLRYALRFSSKKRSIIVSYKF